MATECKTCTTLKRLNNDLIRNQYLLIRDYKRFVQHSVKTNEEVLENIENALAAFDCLIQDQTNLNNLQ